MSHSQCNVRRFLIKLKYSSVIKVLNFFSKISDGFTYYLNMLSLQAILDIQRMNCLYRELKTKSILTLHYLQNISSYVIIECKMRYVYLKKKCTKFKALSNKKYRQLNLQNQIYCINQRLAFIIIICYFQFSLNKKDKFVKFLPALRKSTTSEWLQLLHCIKFYYYY